MMAAFRRGSATQMALFDWGCWFFKMRGFDYNCMGFLLLTYDHTIAYWKSIYFSAHICIVVFIIIGYIFKPKKSRKTEWKTSLCTSILYFQVITFKLKNQISISFSFYKHYLLIRLQFWMFVIKIIHFIKLWSYLKNDLCFF